MSDELRIDSIRNNQPQVLLVEDNVSQQNFLSEVLSYNGFGCTPASTIQEAKLIFQPGKFACALIDLGLPDGDGITLVKHFGELDSQVVRIVLTGDASSETVIGCMRAGAFDYLTKPVDVTTLSASISRAVEHHFVLLERAELFRLLHEEREHLRAMVDAATQDIRKYAANCEAGNARLRSLLQLVQVPNSYSSEQELVLRFFREARVHVPLRAVALCDHSIRKGVAVYLKNPDTVSDKDLIAVSKTLDELEYDPLLAEAEPESVLANWLKRQTALNTGGMQIFTYPLTQWRQSHCKVAFFADSSHLLGPNDREFLDMCAYLLAFEWERNKLLVHIAHQASLGNIAVELVRGFIQPLTALRTAADFLSEIIPSSEALEGIRVIEENAERLWRQAQGFRKLSLLRENAVETVRVEDYINQALDMLSVTIQNKNITVEKVIRTDGECLVINGIALARTFLDVILAALRSCEVGGTVRITLRNASDEHVAFELQHTGGQKSAFVDSFLSSIGPISVGDSVDLGLRLAERTVHSCGGTLSIETEGEGKGLLRITLPRGVKRLAEE